MRIPGSTILAVALVVAFVSTPAVAGTEAGDIGVGIMAGEPTGLSFKWWLDDLRAVDAATGWSLGDDNFYVHCDYLWHIMLEDTDIGGDIPLYFGAGVRLLLHDDDDSRFGVRIPVGLDYVFDNGRFDVFIEIAPIFDLVPETEFAFSGGVGARYYF